MMVQNTKEFYDAFANICKENEWNIIDQRRDDLVIEFNKLEQMRKDRSSQCTEPDEIRINTFLKYMQDVVLLLKNKNYWLDGLTEYDCDFTINYFIDVYCNGFESDTDEDDTSETDDTSDNRAEPEIIDLTQDSDDEDN